jgi:short-subunit dehydrogenase
MPRAPRIAVRQSTVLLTGASGGIGQAIAYALAARGANLLLSGRRADTLDELAGTVDGRALTCDLSSRADVAALGETAAQAGTGILIANAAVPASGTLDELTQDQIDTMLEVNLRAPMALTHALIPGMIARGAGQLVFISSLQGKAATPGAPLYLATKFGLRGFALGMREDLRSHGVGVSTVFPGFIRDAGMFADSGVTLPPGVGTRSPQDVADAVLRAIDEDRAELDVAPMPLRVGAAAAGLAPSLAAGISRRLGSHKIATAIADTQRGQR